MLFYASKVQKVSMDFRRLIMYVPSKLKTLIMYTKKKKQHLNQVRQCDYTL